MEPKRAAALSVPSLALIGVCLFAPTYESCSAMHSPAYYARENPIEAAMATPFLVALPLVALLLVALGRRGFGDRLSRAFGSLVGLTVSSSVATIALLLKPLTAFIVLLSVVTLAGLVPFVRAWRVQKWPRALLLLDAYTLFALPLALFFVHARRSDLGPGAYGYFAALGWLLVIAAMRAIKRA